MNIEDLADESDTSDEDYVPSEKQNDVPSEVDSDGELEEPLSESENSQKRGQKRKKRPTKTKKKVKNQLQHAKNSNYEQDEQKPKENDEKQNVDDIWADFMKDTGFRPKTSKNDTANLNVSQPEVSNRKANNSSEKPSVNAPLQKSVKVTQIFEFAGEEVKVEKEVPANSAEARLLSKTLDEAPKTGKGKKGGLSGISSVLSQLGKKPKITTLEKSKLDWDKFKKEENIEEELQTYNKGKDGFLDRQDFLQRADLRRFEIEKDIRAVERNKRFNSTL